MKLLIVLAVAVMVSARPGGEHYGGKFDNIDIKDILGNARLLQSYYDCLMDVAGSKCTAEGKELRELIPDAINSNCMKCSEEQKEKAVVFMDDLEKKDPTKFNSMIDKYDPGNKHRKDLEEFRKKHYVS